MMVSAPSDSDLDRNFSLSAGMKWTDRRRRLAAASLLYVAAEDEYNRCEHDGLGFVFRGRYVDERVARCWTRR